VLHLRLTLLISRYICYSTLQSSRSLDLQRQKEKQDSEAWRECCGVMFMGKCGKSKIREGIVGKGCLRCGCKQVSRGRFFPVSVVWGKDWRAFASAAARPMHMELAGSGF
jgi:hypothetical protein